MTKKIDLTPVLKAVNPDEAIAFFRQKGYRIGFDHRDVWQQEHQAAFTVAKAMQVDLLAEIRLQVDAAISNGITLATFNKELIPRLQARGWWGRQEMTDPADGIVKNVQLGSPRRLETIFDTNLATAYSEGQWERIQRNQQLFPFLEYVRSASVNPRDTHLAYVGLVLRADDPFWQSHLPVKEYGCKCTVIQHSQRMLDREGLKVGTAPPEVMRSLVNKRTGEVQQVPVGVDPAFNYPPGGRRANLEKMLADKQAAFAAGEQSRRAAHSMMNEPSKHQVHRMPIAPSVPGRVLATTGLDIAGFLSTFDSSGVGHIVKTHGSESAETAKAQVPVTLDDFRHEPLIVDAADSIALSQKKTATGLDAVIFTKQIEGQTFVLVKEVRVGRKHLATKTLYKKPRPEK